MQPTPERGMRICWCEGPVPQILGQNLSHYLLVHLVISFTELLHPQGLLCFSVLLQRHLADPSQQSRNSSCSLNTLSKVHCYKARLLHADPSSQATERASPLSVRHLLLNEIHSDEEIFTRVKAKKPQNPES